MILGIMSLVIVCSSTPRGVRTEVRAMAPPAFSTAASSLASSQALSSAHLLRSSSNMSSRPCSSSASLQRACPLKIKASIAVEPASVTARKLSIEECEAAVVAGNPPSAPAPPVAGDPPPGTPVITPQILMKRPRRNRKSAALRDACQETIVTPANFILPLFIHEGEESTPIGAMPGCYRLGWRHGLIDEVYKARDVGVNSVVLFPKVPDALKSATGDEAYNPNGEGITVLVIGGGGREHALCYGLQQSSTCDAVFCAPGNPGIAAAGDATCIPDLDISTSSRVISFCREQGVGLVVVGPEAPLVAGLVDDLQASGILAFGPSAKAAALEGSKDFMKRLCIKYDIPTAKYKAFTNAKDAKRYIKEIGTPIVVKADGLAAGKGVIIATTLEEAFTAVDSMLVDKVFGTAGGLVIVEEFLDGEEVSFFALVDGENAVPMASAQDHKRVGDGDTGPNTGGMGAYSPAPVLTPKLEAVVMDSIILPTVKGMANEGCKFVGVLYAGLILDKKSGIPKLLEYNVRFGDPECQVLIPRLQSDLASALLAACKGELEGLSLSWSDEAALVVVLASEGYPGKYKKGTLIRNLKEAEAAAPKTKIFHAGTDLDANGNVIATGGRVLGVASLGKDIAQAQERAYQAVDHVNWPDGFFRHDIGWRAVAGLQEINKAKI